VTHDHLTAGARSAGAEDDGSAAFIALRPRLLGIAYRLLGSMWDAEDVVADAMVRWLRTDRSEVRAPAAIFTVLNPDKLSYLYRQTGGPPVAEGG
jgi:DNA-directed RNA polymerase specialized sigma24 family protein